MIDNKTPQNHMSIVIKKIGERHTAALARPVHFILQQKRAPFEAEQPPGSLKVQGDY